MNKSNLTANITFIGSGISTSFSLLNLLNKIGNSPRTNKTVTINLIEKYPEFHLGIPYGKRSGFSTLLITSLKNFLVESERTLFIKWLNENKEWLLDEYLKEGGELSKKWLQDNKKTIDDGKWESLFIPRRFFGCYIDLKVKSKIKELTDNELISVNHITAEVIDIHKKNNFYDIELNKGLNINSEKVVLSVGSLPVKNIWQNKELIEDKKLLFINTPYKPDINFTLNKINAFLSQRALKQTNVLIVGANASALELVYKINDFSKEKYQNTKFTFISSQGLIPDGLINDEKLKHYTPIHLNALKKEKNITAKIIAEATFKDLDIADEINLGAASTVDIISKRFGKLLEKLDEKELEIFACDYGNEIGKRQRCAGLHYLNVIKNLKHQNKFHHIAGRFINMKLDPTGNYNLEYLDTATKTNTQYHTPFHIVINCVGSKNLLDKSIPVLIKNLIEKKYCVPNNSKIGFHVNEKLETKENLYIMGPMLAGNVIENKAVWHVEHCGRIIWLSKVLSKILFDELNAINTTKLKKYELEVINLDTSSNIKTYNNLLKKNWNNNVYYAYDHLKQFENTSNSLKYFLFKINNSNKILMPLIFRELKTNSIDSKYFDVITPYGYGGPLYNNNEISKDDLKAFWNHVDTWYKNNNVVTEFIRFSLNKNYLGYTGHLVKSLQNIKGEILNDFEEQWNSFVPKVRNNYRKAVSYNLSFKIFTREKITKEIVKCFSDIYTKTMIRRNAKDIYFFSLNYFETLILNNLNEFVIAITYLHGKAISSELIIKNNDTLFAFLGGTDSDYFHCRPNDYLRVEIIKWAIQRNYKHYVLGGGLKDGDGLYKSKKYLFPKTEDVTFYTGRKVINHQIYNELINSMEVEFNDIPTLIKNVNTFFPVYRQNYDSNNITFNIITTKKDWQKALNEVGNFDFYHTYDYHHLSKNNEDKAILLNYKEGDIIICLPLIVREIANTSWYDATSVYGYAGPLHKNLNTNFDNSNFNQTINTYFEKNKIISVFSRLNPYISQQEIILNNIGKINSLGNVVNIDLTKSIDEQRSEFSKTTKRYLNKCKKLLDIKSSNEEADIELFIDMYYENMDRVNASKMYYFSKDYFHKLLKSTDFKTEIIYARDKQTGKFVSGALMIKTNNIIQYHLSGTKSDSLKISPLRLLIDEMRVKSSNENYKYFNLGGGLGNNDDELFRFKASFSKDLKPFKVWKHIVDKEIYTKLVEESNVDKNSQFFPLYRDKTT